MPPLPFNYVIGLLRSGGGVSTPVLPQSANIVFKLSADSLVLSNGASVDTWTDSINSVSATASGTSRPTYQTNLFGSKPGIRFNGSTNVMQLGRPAALTAAFDSTVYSTVIVCRVNAGTSYGVMFGAFNGTGVGYIADGTSLGRYQSMLILSSGAGLNVMGSTSQGAPVWSSSGASLERSYLNGTCAVSEPATAPTTGAANFAIGARADLANYASVDIFEILVWDSALTPSEMFAVQAWVCDKYTQTTPWAALPYITVFDGDSLTKGYGSLTYGNYPNQAASSMSLPMGGWTNVGIEGMKLRDMTAKLSEFSGIASATGKPVRVAAFEYYNEKSTAPATMQGYLSSYASAVRGTPNYKLILGSSTSSVSDPDANRSAYNSWLDSNSASVCDAYAPIHTNSSIGISGAAATDGNTTYFNDGIHLKNAGYTVLAGIMTTAIQSLP